MLSFLPPQAQTRLSIHAMDTLLVHCFSRPQQQHVQPPISKSRFLRVRPLVYELHPFFAMTAFSISLSRLRSTTSFFNFVFSSRNCFASCASLTSIPPYFAFQA